MSWEIVDANSNAEGIPWISLGVHGKRTGYLQAKLSMSKSVVRHLGIKSGQPVMVRNGLDNHSGWIQIQAAPRGFNGGYTASDRKAALGNLTFRFSGRKLNLRDHGTVKITTDDASLVLTEDGGVPCIQVEIPKTMRWSKT